MINLGQDLSLYKSLYPSTLTCNAIYFRIKYTIFKDQFLVQMLSIGGLYIFFHRHHSQNFVKREGKRREYNAICNS